MRAYVHKCLRLGFSHLLFRTASLWHVSFYKTKSPYVGLFHFLTKWWGGGRGGVVLMDPPPLSLNTPPPPPLILNSIFHFFLLPPPLNSEYPRLPLISGLSPPPPPPPPTISENGIALRNCCTLNPWV